MPAHTYTLPSAAGVTRSGTPPQALTSPTGYDQRSAPVRASTARSLASCHR
ncbi:hypothetical protein GA0115246_106181 [Streptomyces sp. SolWspMP-sol7th]|nr:hypothetical protein GA0115246_106181 [Streptomyces sp. SolWspMP-sol7th]